MGGFHGGHSGGHSGGFHGGSSRSHSSHSTTHHYSHSSFHIYSGGRSSNSYNRSRVANIFVYFFLSILFIIFAIVAFALCMDVAVKATITKAQITKSGNYKYEVYDFEYKYNNMTYYGYGDDDLAADGSLSIKEGETYTLYVSITNPSDYRFKSKATIAIVALIGFGGLSIFFLTKGIILFIRFKRQLRQIGDANNDGLINESDIDYAEAKNSGIADGIYEGTKKAETENAYLKNKIYRRCPYCDSIVDDDAKFCPNCGSNLNDK